MSYLPVGIAAYRRLNAAMCALVTSAAEDGGGSAAASTAARRRQRPVDAARGLQPLDPGAGTGPPCERPGQPPLDAGLAGQPGEVEHLGPRAAFLDEPDRHRAGIGGDTLRRLPVRIG